MICHQSKFLSLLFLLGCMSLLMVGCKRGSEEEEEAPTVPVPVITTLVWQETVRRPIPCRGIVHPLRQEKLSFLAGGRIAAAYVSEGKRVSRGDILAALDGTSLTQAWVQAGLKLIEARKNLLRMQRLSEEGKISKAKCDEEERRTAFLRESYFEAKSARRKANLIAPFDGRIIDWFVTRGDSAALGQAVVIIAELDPLALARVGLPESDYYRVQVGDSAVVVPTDVLGLPLSGTVKSKGLAGDVAGLPFSADVLFENPGGVAGVGTRVSATITTKRRQKVVLVPRDALVDRQDGSASVFLTDEKAEIALRRHVILGPELGRNIIIDKGLRGGERLIIHGQDRLRHGERIVLMRRKMR
jgi:RND family efflux transporter MFP subunit